MKFYQGLFFLLVFMSPFLVEISDQREIPIPFMVSVEVEGVFQCSGAVLSVFWVLTVASCVYNKSPVDVIVRANTAVPLKRGHVHRVRAVITNPQYLPNNVLQANIALLKVHARFKFGSRIYPITLWPHTPERGSIGWETGWCRGQAEIHGKRKILKTAVILQSDSCAFADNNTGLICVTRSAASSSDCLGEVGDLLVVRNRLAGFNLLKVNNAFAVHRSVGLHIPWIKKTAFGIS